MKIAVTAKGNDLDAPMDPRFGRAQAFFIWDSETKTGHVIDNSAGVNAAGGAGVTAAQTMSQAGVTVVITGHAGPKAFSGLQASGIDVYLAQEGTIRQVIEAFEAGTLEKQTSV